MHTLGLSLGEAMAMDWLDLIAWWGEARFIEEGPEKDG